MSSPLPDYKSTLRLPQTDFPMKGNLPQREPEIIQRWQTLKIYEKVLAKNAGRPIFTLPDGPPYANGSIHIGHALNKTLKDFIIKYKNMRGFQSSFIPGWDCHGLPIEHKVMKDLNEKKLVKSEAEVLTLCRAEAQKWIDHQSKQFQRLGVLADWQHPYTTMSAEYEAEEVREFARIFKKGLIYRGLKPVYWNWTLKTALADAEVEYHMHRSPSIFAKFNVTDVETLGKLGFSQSESQKAPVSFVIWTTTPWTLPANVGICVHPDFDYGVFETKGESLVIAKALKDSFEKETGLTLTEKKSILGKDLEFCKARHPWIDRDSLIILGQHVTQETGTGCVHTAPGHGADDYKVGHVKYQLPLLCPVNDAGQFTDDVPEYKGINIFKANPMIVEQLKKSGHLLGYAEIEHSYPHCWRSKTPLIFRTTPQWFLGVDLEGSNLRQKILAEMESVQFFPEWGKARFQAMMENRPDWCLSRQRIWGVPIPILTCVETGEPLADYDVMMRIADVIENKGGIDAYYQTPANELAGAAATANGLNYKHGKDILDVWFDSGVCHAAVQRRRTGMSFPADLYLEGSDQHRGWFNTSMLSSMATQERSPFKALLTHGFVTDPQGRKMSKSLGNVIDPNEVSSKSGSEIIRLWAAYSDYGNDVSCGPEELNRVTETYRRIRNTMRFLLGTLSDFDVQKDRVPFSGLNSLDQWALHELGCLNEKVIAAYENYEFYKVYHALNTFYTVTLSATYLDILKDRLYTWKADGLPRRGAQTVLYDITDYLIRMMAPILSFLAEESYDYFKGKSAESPLLLEFPVAPAQWKNLKLAAEYELLLGVRTEVQKTLELLRADRVIGSSLEALVKVQAEGEVLSALQKHSDLREFFIVSEVEVKEGSPKVMATRVGGEKCVRCWNYSPQIGLKAELPGICPKCTEALS